MGNKKVKFRKYFKINKGAHIAHQLWEIKRSATYVRSSVLHLDRFEDIFRKKRLDHSEYKVARLYNLLKEQDKLHRKFLRMVKQSHVKKLRAERSDKLKAARSDKK